MEGESHSEGPRPGDRINDRYEVMQVLGRGGMGIVVAARHLELGHQVAIKMLLPSGLAAKEAVGRFLREGRAAGKLTSEHAVRVIDYGKTSTGAPFLVMEFLRGKDLGAVLDERGPLPLGEVASILVQACEALAEAHALGIVHRDLKPSNLFLVDRPEAPPLVKVLDFGISKFVDGGDEEQSLTGTKTTLGTPLYMSPEQVRNAKHVDQRTDIWALGVLLQELLTARPPFEGSSFSALCAAIMVDTPTPIRRVWPGAPPEIEALLARCLEKDASKRLGSVREFAAALRPHMTSSLPSASRLVVSPAGTHETLPIPSSTLPAPPRDEPVPSQGRTAPTGPDTGSSQSLVGLTAGNVTAPGGRRGKGPMLIGAGALVALIAGGTLLSMRAGGESRAAQTTTAEPPPSARPVEATAASTPSPTATVTAVPVASAAAPPAASASAAATAATPAATATVSAATPTTAAGAAGAAGAGKGPSKAATVTKGPAKGYSPSNDDRK